jgi:dTDP-4-amino-4,6-dideoxygalactose transaminase
MAITLVGSYRTGLEQAYVAEALSGPSLGADGPFNRRCERLLSDITGCARALLTSSCSSALHLAGLVLGLGHGSEIVVPSYAFASCASVFMSLGARIVFADSHRDTPNVSADDIRRVITRRTGAILAIHYAGIPCDMDELLDISRETGIPLVEDAAHALFGQYKGRALGSLGILGALSFDYAKNVTCGEGGALLVNDIALLESAETAYQRGTNRARLLRGESTRYEWLGPGGNYSTSELQAAYLCAQLEGARAMQERRARIWATYKAGLCEWASARGVTLPSCPPDCLPAYHLFFLIYPDARSRDATIRFLGRHGIAAAFHYLPLHMSPAARLLGATSRDCPVAARLSERLLRIPFHPGLSDDDVRRVIDHIQLVDF